MPYRTSRKREGQEGLCTGSYAIILNSLNMIIRTTVASNASPLLKSTRFPYKYPKIGIFTLVYYPRG